MKRDLSELAITLFLFILSLVCILLLPLFPEYDDGIILVVIISQIIGIVITIVSGLTNNRKEK